MFVAAESSERKVERYREKDLNVCGFVQFGADIMLLQDICMRETFSILMRVQQGLYLLINLQMLVTHEKQSLHTYLQTDARGNKSWANYLIQAVNTWLIK